MRGIARDKVDDPAPGKAGDWCPTTDSTMRRVAGSETAPIANQLQPYPSSGYDPLIELA